MSRVFGNNTNLDWLLWSFLISLFVLQLSEVKNPPLDVHAWRQCYTLGVSNNYYEGRTSFLVPKTILCDSREGIIGQEFPLLNGVIAGGWTLFGKKPWVFRLTTSLFFLAGLFFFFQAIKLMRNEPFALIATLLLGSSLMFKYGNKAMPDVFGVSVVLIAIYYGTRYLLRGKFLNLMLWTTLVGLGVLSKMPSGIVALLILVPLLNPKVSFARKKMLAAISLIPLMAVLYWYFLWVPTLENIEGFQLYYPTDLSEGWQEIRLHGYDLLRKFTHSAFIQPITFIFSLIGIGLVFRRAHRSFLLPSILTSILTCYFILKSGKVFCTHEYYLVPVLPMLSILATLSLMELAKFSSLLPCIASLSLALFSLKNQNWDLKIRAENHRFMTLTELVDDFIPKESRILTNDIPGSPRMMYMSNRRGWNSDRWADTDWVLGESTVGLEYLVLDKRRVKTTNPFPVLYEDADFLIQKVESPDN